MSDEPQDQASKAVADRAIVLVKNARELDTLETEILSQRLGEGQEAAEAYLYIIEIAGQKPIVGASVDFVRQAVRQMNASGAVHLTVDDIPPIVEEIMVDDRPHVRVLVRSVDKLTGEMKWALKEEARVTVSDRGKRRNPHAATIALEKAERKALESHPSYNRKLVNKIIKSFLKKAGLDPSHYQIGTGGGAWASAFGRAKKAGVSPEQLRAGVQEQTGKGLSEATTPDEARAAVAAVDQTIRDQAGVNPPPPPPAASPRARRGVASPSSEPTSQPPQPPVPRPAPRPIEEDPEVITLRTQTLEDLHSIGADEEDIKSLWAQLGPPSGHPATYQHYQRMARAAGLLKAHAPMASAVTIAKSLYPVPEDKHGDQLPNGSPVRAHGPSEADQGRVEGDALSGVPRSG